MNSAAQWLTVLGPLFRSVGDVELSHSTKCGVSRIRHAYTNKITQLHYAFWCSDDLIVCTARFKNVDPRFCAIWDSFRVHTGGKFIPNKSDCSFHLDADWVTIQVHRINLLAVGWRTGFDSQRGNLIFLVAVMCRPHLDLPTVLCNS